MIELRKSSTKVRAMLEDMIVMCQPSAFCDSITVSWHLEIMSTMYGQSLCIRDLFSGAYCDKSRTAMSAINQIPSWIISKMTPVLQLTDTTAARPMKISALHIQDKIRRELKEKAVEEGVPPIYKCGVYEVLRIAHEAVIELKEYMDGPEERTVRDTISNGILAYRPDYITNKLKPIIEEEWCKKKGWCPGNHRRDNDWVSNRYNWLD